MACNGEGVPSRISHPPFRQVVPTAMRGMWTGSGRDAAAWVDHVLSEPWVEQELGLRDVYTLFYKLFQDTVCHMRTKIMSVFHMICLQLLQVCAPNSTPAQEKVLLSWTTKKTFFGPCDAGPVQVCCCVSDMFTEQKGTWTEVKSLCLFPIHVFIPSVPCKMHGNILVIAQFPNCGHFYTFTVGTAAIF